MAQSRTIPRPLVALAVIFAIVIGVAAVLLYRADVRDVRDAMQSAAPSTEAPGAAATAQAPATQAEAPAMQAEAPAMSGEASGGMASEAPAATGERVAAAVEVPISGEAAGTGAEGAPTSGEQNAMAANTPMGGEASLQVPQEGTAEGGQIAAAQAPVASGVESAGEAATASAEQEAAGAVPLAAGEAVGGAPEGTMATGEQNVAAAEAPSTGEASGAAPVAPSGGAAGEVAGAAGSAAVTTAEATAPKEPEQRVEIGPVEASAANAGSGAAGAADIGNSLVVAADQGQAGGLSVSAEAAPRALDPSKVTIKAAEAEAGTLYVAGGAPPGTLVRVYANEQFIGQTRTGQEGTWLIEAAREVPIGEVVFRVEAVPESESDETPIVQASAPFMRYADGVVLEPVVSASASEQSLVSEASLPRPTYVIIRRGDSLWRIARRNYGRGVKYEAIFAANRDSIDNPHWIFPGQVFIIPTSDRSWATD